MKTEYNSKLDKQLEVFVQMRIEGYSFDAIATELKTSKQTLIEWNKKELVRTAIDEGKAFKINTLVKTYKFDLANRTNTYLQLSQKINDELLNRDLKEVSTDVLLKMSIANDTRVHDLLKGKHRLFGVANIEVVKFSDDKDSFFYLKYDE